MNNSEFSNEFDVLYNSITSNQAPGLDEYEKSVFLTKAQDEIVKSYFNPRSNKTQEGFDGNEKRQIDFSMIMRSCSYKKITAIENATAIEAVPPIQEGDNTTEDQSGLTESLSASTPYNNIYDSQVSVVTRPGVAIDYKIEYIPQIEIIDKNLPYEAIVDNADKYITSIDRNVFDVVKGTVTVGGIEYPSVEANPFTSSFFDLRENTKAVTLNSDVLMFVNEYVEVTRNGKTVRLTVLPINYVEYSRLMSKPYKRPLKNQAWRLLDNSDGSKKAELVVGPIDVIKKYVTRYVKRPRAIILDVLSDGTSLDGYVGADSNGNPTSEISKAVQGITCELDPILHPEILQRAVELAKAAYSGDLTSQITLGQASQTNIGAIQSSK